jgi:hypothetical protein
MKKVIDRRLDRQKVTVPEPEVDTSDMDPQQAVLRYLETGRSLGELVQQIGPFEPRPQPLPKAVIAPVTDALPPPAKPRKETSPPPPEKRATSWWEEHARWRVPGSEDVDDGRPYSETIHEYDPFEWRLREFDDE